MSKEIDAAEKEALGHCTTWSVREAYIVRLASLARAAEERAQEYANHCIELKKRAEAAEAQVEQMVREAKIDRLTIAALESFKRSVDAERTAKCERKP